MLGWCAGSGGGVVGFNAMAVAARAVQRQVGQARRVLVVNWAVNPASGLQQTFYKDPSVPSAAIVTLERNPGNLPNLKYCKNLDMNEIYHTS